MKLKNIILRDRDYVKTSMDQTQHIAVSGDFLFVTVLGRRFYSINCRIRVLVVTIPSMALEASVLCTKENVLSGR